MSSIVRRGSPHAVHARDSGGFRSVQVGQAHSPSPDDPAPSLERATATPPLPSSACVPADAGAAGAAGAASAAACALVVRAAAFAPNAGPCAGGGLTQVSAAASQALLLR